MTYPLTCDFYSKNLSLLAYPFNQTTRLVDERQNPYRSPFQRDRDRIIHSNLFRRLKHKTQVFVSPVGDHFRTRLTHSLEVSQIARSLARTFGVDEDLSEALALVHDIGHPPFGHSGEEGLQHKTANFDRFDHNNQALRCVCYIEHRHSQFVGLNLTNITLSAMAKHNGAFNDKNMHKAPKTIVDLCQQMDIDLHSQPPLEAQLTNVSDDIAYNGHDIDDGFRSNILSFDDICKVAWLQKHINVIQRNDHISDKAMIISELVRRIIGDMINDIINQTATNIHTYKIIDYRDIINHDTPIVHFSPAMQDNIQSIRNLLYKNLYFSPQISVQRQGALDVIHTLFDAYMGDIDFVSKYDDDAVRSLHVSDYISGMTDTFAIQEYCHISGKKIDQLPFNGRFQR